MPDLDHELDLFVDRCESAWQGADNVDVATLLPPSDHPGYVQIAVELLRVDLEHRRARGLADASLDSYVVRFPDLFSEPARLEPLAFEEFRLRLQDGEAVTPDDYSARYGILTEHWRDMAMVSTVGPGEDPSYPAGHPCQDDDLREDAEFGPFVLGEELGHGAVARVFLARELGVADRAVVVKFAATKTVEIDRLGRLQHSNIVPIHSVHQYRAHGSAICMPYLGRSTLSDLLRARSSSRPSETSEVLSRVISSGILIDWAYPTRWPDFVLELAVGIASGLRHAHDRNVVHADIKPANILLADDGRPMLLDFNLAGDLASLRPEVVGGTFRYMPPEHREAFQTGLVEISPDVRADVFSLGVVLLELLTESADPADASARERLMNSASPAFAAIVLKCVEPHAAERYQSAAALLEDLTRQKAHRPLKHQQEPSARERLQKWSRRHPRLASNATLIPAVLIVLILVGIAWSARSRQLDRLNAETAFADFHDAVPEVCALLSSGDLPQAVEEGLSRAEGLLGEGFADGRFGVSDLLQRDHQVDQRLDVGKLLYYVAHGYSVQAMTALNEKERTAATRRAKRYNQFASAWFLGRVGRVPRAVDVQGLRIGGRSATDAASELSIGPDDPSLDKILLATELNQAREFRRTREYLDEVKADFPDDISFWTLLAGANAGDHRFAEAEVCLTMCLALQPDSWIALTDRGLARMGLKRFQEAEADFGRVIALRPDDFGGYLNRALARAGRGLFAEAITDLSAALQREGPTRIYFLRARYRRAIGDQPGAAADYRQGLATEPGDEKSWVSRGLAKLSQDPAGALADFHRAMEFNRTSVDGLRNIAHVLSERMQDADGAIQALDKLIDAGVDDAGAYAGRAVLHARAGRAQQAIADARRALELDPEPLTKYQAGCVYALLSSEDAAHRESALALLAASLKELPHVLIPLSERDPDLKALTDDPDWIRLQDAAKALHKLEKAAAK